MDINLILPDNSQVYAGRGVPATTMHSGRDLLPKGRNFCHWFPGSPSDDIEGTDVLITAKEYVIGKRRYDLQSGYAIVARLTPKFTLVPRLRKAVSRETEAIRDADGNPINEYWPVLRRIWEEPVAPEPKTYGESFDFVSDAMEALGELNDLTETSDLSDEEPEDWMEDIE